LGEVAKKPKLLETIPRRGYRLLIERTDSLPSIAVLPFQNTAQDAELDYLTDGITESLIRQLALISQLQVIARSTVFKFKGKGDPVITGRKLGVSMVLTGRILRNGTRLVIDADLIEIRTGLHLWGQQYDRSTEDILAVQLDISSEVTKRLRLKISAKERGRVINSGTKVVEAYRSYLRGRYFWNKWAWNGYTKALECFRQAIDADPLYALAYSGLADAYSALGFYGHLPPTESWPRARSAALQALEIDNSSAEAHAALAAVKLFFDWDPEGAQHSCLESSALNPNYPIAYQFRACCLAATAQHTDAIAEAAKAQELDPLSTFAQGFVGNICYFAREYDRAVKELNKALELDPQFGEARRLLGITYIQQGRLNDAVQELEMAVPLLGSSQAALASLGRAYAKLGRLEETEQILSRLKGLAAERRVAAASMAVVYVGLEDYEQAMDWLGRAVENRSSWLVLAKVEPWWDPLRPFPRFEALCRKIQFT
jgi:TolB-like protein/Flp pilus assembly protein TadD